MTPYAIALGAVLRDIRNSKNMTLRKVSSKSHVALGYISEVERGSKDASSIILESICTGLDTELWWVLQQVSDELRSNTNKKEN
jgi:transcriptional regulator with XRE-family HTH domain